MSKIIDLNNEENRIEFSNGVIKGAIFAYPTEAVFGLGCDIRNKESICLLYTSPSPRDRQKSRMPSSA